MVFVVPAVSQVLEASARSLVMPGWAASRHSPGGQPNPVPEPGRSPGLAAPGRPALPRGAPSSLPSRASGSWSSLRRFLLTLRVCCGCAHLCWPQQTRTPGPRGSLSVFPSTSVPPGHLLVPAVLWADAGTAAVGIMGATAPRLGDLQPSCVENELSLAGPVCSRILGVNTAF